MDYGGQTKKSDSARQLRENMAHHECTPAINPSGLFKVGTHAHPEA